MIRKIKKKKKKKSHCKLTIRRKAGARGNIIKKYVASEAIRVLEFFSHPDNPLELSSPVCL